MKTGFKVAGIIAAVLCVAWVVSVALGFVSMPNDISVIAGVIILLLCVVGIISIIERVVQKIKRSLTERQEEK